MNIQTSPVLAATNGQAIPLVGMDIKAKIEGLMTSISVEQTYHNTESINIEAVYTFPLPLDAVLTSLQVKIADRILRAQILEKKAAEARYEEAITDGDTVVMLEKLEAGLYTMNVGNLQADEKISILMEYSFVQRWQGNQLRLFIPTTIAPRYGNAPFAPQQIPEANFFVEHHCKFTVQIVGVLSKAKIASPSHAISVQTEDDSSWINLQQQSTLMDKDFILTIESETDHNLGLISRDRHGFCALASFHPQFAKDFSPQSKNFKILVDCSGSMGGSSIEQARHAVAKIVESLIPGDFFNIVLFGSDHQCIFKQMMPATQQHIQTALQQIKSIDANLGGTEIASALKASYKLKAESKQADEILLITDGEVWDTEAIVQQAIKSKHRIFTVGVGTSVSEGFVRELAEKTGGAAELVSPNENMAERIVRHFNRMRAPAAKKVDVQWSHLPTHQLEVGPVYQGDTVNVWAWFDKQPHANTSLVLHMPNGSVMTQTLQLQKTTDNAEEQLTILSRLATATRINTIDDKNTIVELACAYQLMSKHTNYLMVDVRADKAEDLPELRKVPHMLAEGWGGVGVPLAAAPAMSMDFMKTSSVSAPRAKKSLPGFLRKEVDNDVLSESLATEDWMDVVDQTNSLQDFIQSISNQSAPINIDTISIEHLVIHGLPTNVLAVLRDLEQQGFDSHQIALAYLYYLFDSQNDVAVDRAFTRQLSKAFKQLVIADELKGALVDLI